MRPVISMKMKTAPTLILGILILSLGFVPITAHSQSASLQEPPQKIDHLNIPGQSTLEEAVQHLQRNLPKGQQQLNVIYGDGAESLKVPSLTVRNVTGPDALMLIATATDVQLEPIRGIDEKVVGYKLWKQPAAFNLLGTRYGGIAKDGYRGVSTGKTSQDTAKSQVTQSPEKNIDRQVTVQKNTPIDILPSSGNTESGFGQSFPGFGSENKVRTYGGMSGGGFGGMDGGEGDIYHQPADQSVQSMEIYPLAAITTHYDFPDLEESLRKMFQSEEVSPGLAFHDKTQVLVVRGTERVQRLVQGFLQAMGENMKTEEQVDAVAELDRVKAEKAHLNEQLQEAKTMTRQLAGELKRAQDYTQSFQAGDGDTEVLDQLEKVQARNRELAGERDALSKKLKETEALANQFADELKRSRQVQ